MQRCCSYFPSRNSMRGLSMASASASAVLWLGGPLIWYRISAIWRMQPLMRAWKLRGEEKLDEETSAIQAPPVLCLCVCVCLCVPLSEYSAEVVQVSAELHLQLIEDVSRLRIQLQKTQELICFYSNVLKIKRMQIRNWLFCVECICHVFSISETPECYTAISVVLDPSATRH